MKKLMIRIAALLGAAALGLGAGSNVVSAYAEPLPLPPPGSIIKPR